MKHIQEFSPDPGRAEIRGPPFSNDGKVNKTGYLILLYAKELSNYSLYPIALNGPTNLFANSDAKAGGAFGFFNNGGDKISRMTFITSQPDSLKLFASAETPFRRKNAPALEIAARHFIWTVSWQPKFSVPALYVS